MPGDRLTSKLSQLYGSETTGLQHNPDLEADLLSRYRKLHPQNWRWLMLLNPWNRTARFVLAGLALCVIVIGACSTETITEVDLGKQMKMDLAAVDEGADHAEGKFIFEHVFVYISQEDMTHKCKEISEALISQPGVENASVSFNRQGTGEVSLDIFALGDNVEAEQLVSQLKQTYPFLADASVTVSDLKTTIKESYASKIGRKMFSVELSGTDPETLRRQFLEQMEAQGYDGHAEMIFENEGDHKTISIETEEAE